MTVEITPPAGATVPASALTQGLLANIPTGVAAGNNGRYYATDFKAEFISNGTNAGGTEGNGWTQIAGRGEIGYAEITADYVGADASAHPGLDVPGLSSTVTIGSRPIFVAAEAQILKAAAAQGLTLNEGATQLQYRQKQAGTADGIEIGVRLAPSPGSHTYKVKAFLCTVQAGATYPAFIRINEL